MQSLGKDRPQQLAFRFKVRPNRIDFERVKVWFEPDCRLIKFQAHRLKLIRSEPSGIFGSVLRSITASTHVPFPLSLCDPDSAFISDFSCCCRRSRFWIQLAQDL
jgi:hypothetical protein